MTDPNDLVRCVAGLHFGVIDDLVAKVTGRQVGPIFLPYGIPGFKGFGQQHVEDISSRMAKIRDFGYPTFVDYAHFVCRQYEWITDGHRDRLVLVRSKDGYDLTVVIQYDARPRHGHWAITTGIPKRVHRGDRLWERVQVGRSEPSPGDVEKRPRRETLTLPKTSILDGNRS